MAISRILIENFRSIERCEFAPGQFCALVGQNNAGKSNILRALDLVLARAWVNAGAFSEEDFRDRNTDRNIVIELEFKPALKYRRFKTSPLTEVDIPLLRFTVTTYKVDSARGNKGDLRLDQSCLKLDGGLVNVAKQVPKKGVRPEFEPLIRIPDEVREQIPAIYIDTERRLSDQLPSGRQSLLRRLFEDVNEALLGTQVEYTKENGEKITRPAHDVFIEHLSAALDVLRIKEFNELEAVLRHHSLENLGYDPTKDAERFKVRFDLFDSWDFFRAIRLAFGEAGSVVDATAMGHGAQNALIVAIFQAYEHLRKKGALILIEEPELYLHPHRRRFFYGTLRRVSEKNQIIYTTHSAHFVAVPEYEEVHVVFRNAKDATEVRSSTLAPTPQLREKMRKELDPERNELFFAKHVILVEGDTEKLALPEYARRLGINLDRADVSVVEVGGKRSLKAFVEIVTSFGVPVTLVFDTDSSDFGKDEKIKEEEYNKELRELKGKLVRVVELNPKYEWQLRAEMGEEIYLKLASQYGGVSKVVRARLIAADESAPVPPLAKDVLADLVPAAAESQALKDEQIPF